MKNKLLNQSGLTLIEILASISISILVMSVIYGAFNTSLKINQKTQSHVNLRQEANIIISKLRQQHQGEAYSLCYGNLINNNNIYFEDIHIKNNTVEINKSNKCQNINPAYDLNVQFTLADQQKNTFEINTIIEAKKSLASNVSVDIAYQDKSNPYSSLENIFIYGKQFAFAGSQVNGPNATMVIKGSLLGSKINGGAFSNVTNIYIDGDADFDNGSAGLGSSTYPGTMYINGNLNLWSGTRNIYGDVYVNGNFNLKDARIYGNIYVNGNVTLGWTPTLATYSRIYYTGSLSVPDSYDQSILSKVKKRSSVPGFTIPNYDIPPLKSDQWYTNNGYVNAANLNINKKIYTTNPNASINGSGQNVIIVGKGNININEGWSEGVSGIIYAPYGKVTFNGKSFTGIVIARDGFEVTSGGTIVTFQSINTFIKNTNDYPF